MGRNNTRAARRAAAAAGKKPSKQAVVFETPEDDAEADTSTATPSSGIEDVENLSTSSPASNAEEDAVETHSTPEIVIAEDIQESPQEWDVVEVAKPHESVGLSESVEAEISTAIPPNEEDADQMSTCPPSSKVEEIVDDVESSATPSVSDKVAEEASARIATEFIVDLQPQSKTTQADERLQRLCTEVTNLSQNAFGEDACKAVSGHSSWRLTVLIGSEDPEGSDLVGFVVYRFRTDPRFRCLSIAKIAVHPDHRRHGYGSTILAWCVARAKAQREITSVKLCALAEVVHWYRKRGFKREMKLEDDEDHVPGQVAMAKYLPIRGAPLGKARRR
mmetsp:Transcript_15825/g.28843  ORF Transcript_15825/g.28843 Transcript_15825/m.28843 type:complete len:334 (+) Transcript_15825:124-1125(+)